MQHNGGRKVKKNKIKQLVVRGHLVFDHLSPYQLEKIFRKKKDRTEGSEDVQRFDQQVGDGL